MSKRNENMTIFSIYVSKDDEQLIRDAAMREGISASKWSRAILVSKAKLSEIVLGDVEGGGNGNADNVQLESKPSE